MNTLKKGQLYMNSSDINIVKSVIYFTTTV